MKIMKILDKDVELLAKAKTITAAECQQKEQQSEQYQNVTIFQDCISKSINLTNLNIYNTSVSRINYKVHSRSLSILYFFNNV